MYRPEPARIPAAPHADLVSRHSQRPQTIMAVSSYSPFASAALSWLVLWTTASTSCHRPTGHEHPRPRDDARQAGNNRDTDETQILGISILQVGSGKEHRPKHRFFRGERVDLLLAVTGFAAPGRRLHLRSTLTMQRPGHGTLWVEGPRELVDQRIPKGRSQKRVRLKVGLQISSAEPKGPHRLMVRLDEPGSKRFGTAAVEFVVVGRPLAPADEPTITRFVPPVPLDLRPGGLAHVHMWVAGLDLPRSQDGAYVAQLEAETTWTPKRGGAETKKTLELGPYRFPFLPAQIPLTIPVAVPRKTGHYDLTIILRRRDGSSRTPLLQRTIHDMDIQPAGLGIYDLSLLGPANVSENTFFRGQRLQATFEAWGPLSSDLIGDLAVTGPDGGIYFLKKSAFRIKKPLPNSTGTIVARRLAVPMWLPMYCPRGTYQLMIRIRETTGAATASRQISFTVQGPTIPPLPSLAITEWSISNRPVLLPLLHQGQQVPIRVVIGGMKVQSTPPAKHRVDIGLNLILRTKEGKLLAKIPEAAHLSKTFTFFPRRIPLAAQWRVPDGVKGLLLLQVEAEDYLSRKVSLSQKKVVVAPR